MLNLAKARGSISSVPIGKGFVCINHIFFPGDSLLFCKVNSLDLYKNALGQMLIKEKTSILFS